MTANLGTLMLEWISRYGAPLVGGVLYLVALGVPLPGTLILIASGAFVREHMLNIVTAPLLGYLGTVAGDFSVYLVGYLASGWIEKRFGHTSAWKSARSLFHRRGWAAIYLTRWLLTSVALPVTLIAGSSRYPFRKFFVFDVLGELTWFAIYGGLGYAFGSHWELISKILSNFSGLILGGLALVVGIVVFVEIEKRKTAVPVSLPQPSPSNE